MHRSALLAFAMLAGACANVPADAPLSDASSAGSGPIVGGYGPADPADPGVAEAEKLALDEIYRREPQRSLVDTVTRESQVVAGMNYRFSVTMSSRVTYRIIVYKPLDGAMSVTGFEKITPLS